MKYELAPEKTRKEILGQLRGVAAQKARDQELPAPIIGEAEADTVIERVLELRKATRNAQKFADLLAERNAKEEEFLLTWWGKGLMALSWEMEKTWRRKTIPYHTGQVKLEKVREKLVFHDGKDAKRSLVDWLHQPGHPREALSWTVELKGLSKEDVDRLEDSMPEDLYLRMVKKPSVLKTPILEWMRERQVKEIPGASRKGADGEHEMKIEELKGEDE